MDKKKEEKREEEEEGLAGGLFRLRVCKRRREEGGWLRACVCVCASPK